MLTGCLVSFSAAADELLLRDGSRILGTAIRKEGNTLEFKTSFAGTLQVKWDQVRALRTERPAQVLLSNDVVISARIFTNEAHKTLVQTATEVAARTFSAVDVAFINPEPARKVKRSRPAGRDRSGRSRARDRQPAAADHQEQRLLVLHHHSAASTVPMTTSATMPAYVNSSITMTLLLLSYHLTLRFFPCQRCAASVCDTSSADPP
jgi:hypothetical protein